jgi:phosphatidylinositol-3-phosphatase
MVPRKPRLAVRHHRTVVVVLAVSIALAMSALGIGSASASTRARLAVSLNPDRSSATRLNGSTVNGKIYVFVRSSKTLEKVDFYLDSPVGTQQPPAQTDEQAPFDFAGTATDGTASPFDTSKLADGSHIIRAVMTWRNGTTSTQRGQFEVNNGGIKPTPSPSPTSTTPAPATTTTTTAPATTTTTTAPATTTTTTAPATTTATPTAAAPSPTATATTATPVPNTQSVTKVLTIVEENHSLDQMKAGMPYLYSLAQRFAYADNYVAIRHPSLPNYLAIAGGDTFGVTDDASPASHPLSGQSVFGQAIAHGRRAAVYAESMPGNCVQSSNGEYAVKHNPWPYFVDERSLCNTYDIPETGFGTAVNANALPNAGMLIPNLCNDAHDCSLATADSWLKNRLPNILASSDFTSGKLAVVVTADEDDSNSGNKVLTVVLHASLDGSHKVVSTALTHYSLSRFYSQTTGASPLRKAATAPDMAQAFGLTVGPTIP